MAGALGGVGGALPGGNPLDTLAGGNPLDSLGGPLGGLGDDPLGGLGGLAGGLGGGLLGEGGGLNVIGLVGIGSDDPALLDLNPAEKKQVKAKKAADAARNKQKRDAEMKKLQDQVKAQGGKPTPEQLKAAEALRASQAKDDQEMRVLDDKLGETDPDLLRQEIENPGSTSSYAKGEQAGPSPGLMYAYLVNEQCQPTHVVTFANAAAAQTWYRSVVAQSSVEQVGPQMYSYAGAAPRPTGKGMAYMPIQTVQPILPLQRADGYPICCKQSAVGSSTVAPGQSTATRPPAPPPRQKPTHKDFAESHATQAIAKGDKRPREQIVQEAMQDIADGCAQANGGRPCGSQAAPATGSGYAPATGNSAGPLGSGVPATDALGNPLGAAGGLPATDALGNPTGAAGGGDDLLGGLSGLAGGLLGGGQGLNVAGLVGLGSDDPALLDLNPVEKKQAKLKKAQEIKRQKTIQDQQMAALRKQVAAQGGQPTPQQKAQEEELAKRNAALNDSAGRLRESMRKDEEEERAKGGGLPGGDLTKGLPTSGVTDGLPVNNLPTNGLPTENLPVGGATSSLPVAGGLGKGLGL